MLPINYTKITKIVNRISLISVRISLFWISNEEQEINSIVQKFSCFVQCMTQFNGIILLFIFSIRWKNEPKKSCPNDAFTHSCQSLKYLLKLDKPLYWYFIVITNSRPVIAHRLNLPSHRVLINNFFFSRLLFISFLYKGCRKT